MNRLSHYTTLTLLPQILNSGHLLPHMDGRIEKSVVWLSSDSFWEPTATKPCRTDSALVSLKFWEYRDLFGCIRFALPADDSRLPAAIPLADMSLEILSINEWRTVS